MLFPTSGHAVGVQFSIVQTESGERRPEGGKGGHLPPLSFSRKCLTRVLCTSDQCIRKTELLLTFTSERYKLSIGASVDNDS